MLPTAGSHLLPRALAVLAALVVLAGLSLLGAGRVSAGDAAPRFTSLKVSVYPEYDQPRILVMYEGQLADDVPLPVVLRYGVPAGAQVASACAVDERGQHTALSWQEIAGENRTISYTLKTRATHMEFYYQPIEGAGRRELSYTLHTPAAADYLQVEIQRPLRATEFALVPASPAVLSDAGGFQYHRYDYTDVAAGQEMAFAVTYEKPDGSPSIESQQAGASAATGAEYALPLVLIGLGTIVLSVFLFLRGRERPRAEVASASRAPRRKGGGRSQAAGAPLVEARFCTACGDRLRPEAAFCTACGRPVKKQK